MARATGNRVKRDAEAMLVLRCLHGSAQIVAHHQRCYNEAGRQCQGNGWYAHHHGAGRSSAGMLTDELLCAVLTGMLWHNSARSLCVSPLSGAMPVAGSADTTARMSAPRSRCTGRVTVPPRGAGCARRTRRGRDCTHEPKGCPQHPPQACDGDARRALLCAADRRSPTARRLGWHAQCGPCGLGRATTL
jgi:hypothetical protein